MWDRHAVIGSDSDSNVYTKTDHLPQKSLNLLPIWYVVGILDSYCNKSLNLNIIWISSLDSLPGYFTLIHPDHQWWLVTALSLKPPIHLVYWPPVYMSHMRITSRPSYLFYLVTPIIPLEFEMGVEIFVSHCSVTGLCIYENTKFLFCDI